MGILEMSRQDLLELYQLLNMYERTYVKGRPLSLEGVRKEVSEKYTLKTGEDICQSRNPRKAGRKQQYTEEKNAHIMELYEGGRSLRQTAEESGCSVGHVQDVIKGKRGGESVVYGN